MKTIVKTFSLAALLAASCLGNSLTLIPGSGLIMGAPGSVTGWGYSIANTTVDWLTPTGLFATNPANGMLTDIFDYPSVAPNSTTSLGYTFVAPGGPGNSSGLFEYAVPADLPPGTVESGTINLSYQLYDSNPDISPDANPIGGPATLTPVSYEFLVTSVPEPGTSLLVLSAGLLGIERRLRKTIAR